MNPPTILCLRATQVRLALLACCLLPLAAVAADSANPPGSVLATPPNMTYFAKAGDTLSAIALRFTEKLQNWTILSQRNHIGDDRSIPVGTAILIPLELLPEEASQARVVALAGNPQRINGDETRLKVGSIVTEGTQISTGADGFVTLALEDGSRISIPSNSRIVLSTLRKTKYTASPRTAISLAEGKVESRVAKLSDNKGRFEVRSPLALAGVRGTHFRVGILADGTANEVLEGAVAVDQAEHAAKSALVLPAGSGNIIGRSRIGPSLALLAAPTLDTASLLQIRPTLNFHAIPLAAAQAYHVQIARDAQALDVVMENTFTQPHFKFDGLPDGQYFLRLSAIDQHGLEGLPMTSGFSLKARPEPPFPLTPKNKQRAAQTDFSWTEASAAEAYHLQVARDREFNDVVIDEPALKQLSFSSDKLTDGAYFWRIATVINAAKPDQGPYSDPEAFQKLPAPAAPTVGDTNGSEMALSWAAEAGQTFLIEMSSDAKFSQLFLSRELSTAELKIPRPPAGVYYLRVRATDADGYVAAFTATQKLSIPARWTSSDGSALVSGNGNVGTGF